MSGGLLDGIKHRLRGEARAKREHAVLVHLSTLLNTRQGSSALDLTYGLPDITDFTHNIPGAIPLLERLIVDAIQRYEPRLSHVQVRSSTVHTDALSLSFEVSAQLVGGGSLRFQTTLSAGGQVSVS
ncbi:MAG: type secretion system needle hub protein TssE [Pseudomonadota bacterium]|jgi:type VI secretion system protein